MDLTIDQIQAAALALVKDGEPGLALDFYRVAADAVDPDPIRLAGLAGSLAEALVSRWLAAGTGDEGLEDALELYGAALAGAPNNVDDQVRRLLTLQLLGCNEEWLRYSELLAHKFPETHGIQIHRAFSLLMSGDLARGLPAIARWTNRHPGVDLSGIDRCPTWRPGQPAGPVTCWNIDGSGDVFQLARFYRLAAQDGAELHVAAAAGQERLLARCPGVKHVFRPTDPKPERAVNHWELAAYYTCCEETIPPTPYLSADPDTIGTWRQRLAGIPGYRVGVAWFGDPRQPINPRRSFHPADLAPLFAIPGVSLVSLQKGYRGDVSGTPIRDLGHDYHATGDWLDTAAVIANLDLVIAPCSGVAHLVGGMGRPVWLALSEPGCFRWMAGRTDSPWYPSMRIFRQQRRGEWSGVFEAMAETLTHRDLEAL